MKEQKSIPNIKRVVNPLLLITIASFVGILANSNPAEAIKAHDLKGFRDEKNEHIGTTFTTVDGCNVTATHVIGNNKTPGLVSARSEKITFLAQNRKILEKCLQNNQNLPKNTAEWQQKISNTPASVFIIDSNTNQLKSINVRFTGLVIDGLAVYYLQDYTTVGNSGSPILNEQKEVIGIYEVLDVILNWQAAKEMVTKIVTGKESNITRKVAQEAPVAQNFYNSIAKQVTDFYNNGYSIENLTRVALNTIIETIKNQNEAGSFYKQLLKSLSPEEIASIQNGTATIARFTPVTQETIPTIQNRKKEIDKN